MLGAFLSVEMVPWISLLFAVLDMLFIFCFLPETLPQEKRVGPGPERGEGSCGYERVSFLMCTIVRGRLAFPQAASITAPPGFPGS